jgi:hypothetical protein
MLYLANDELLEAIKDIFYISCPREDEYIQGFLKRNLKIFLDEEDMRSTMKGEMYETK